MKTLVLVLFFVLVQFETFGQIENYNDLELTENGEWKDYYEDCYTKCLLPYQPTSKKDNDNGTFENQHLEVLIYGNLKLLLSPIQTKWVKTKSNSGCHSMNPDDCFIWCLKELAPKIVGIELLDVDDVVVYDFNTTKEMEEKLIKRGVLAWYKTICKEDLTSELMLEIQESLKERGSDRGSNINKSNLVFLNEMIRFQIENELPIGNLNIETLELLGIDFE